jgi:hypothetical protein
MEKQELDLMIEQAVKEALSRVETKCKGCESMNDLKYIRRVGPLTSLLTILLALGGTSSVSYFTVNAREMGQREIEIKQIQFTAHELKTTTDTLTKKVAALEIKHDEILTGINNIENILEKRFKNGN